MFKGVRAGHIISLGLFIYLLAYVGSETIIDEEVTVPANDYLHYAVRVYPGQGIQAYAGVRTLNGTEHEYGVLELMMMGTITSFTLRSILNLVIGLMSGLDIMIGSILKRISAGLESSMLY